jgi:hypothetical protein
MMAFCLAQPSQRTREGQTGPTRSLLSLALTLFFLLNVRSFVQACECNAIAVMPTKMLIATNIPHTVSSLTKHLIYIRVQSDASIIEW